jgi:hypothetical protein
VSYQQLVSIFQENARYKERYVTIPPATCPDDGIPLETGPDGSHHCRFGHYVVLIWDQWVTRSAP